MGECKAAERTDDDTKARNWCQVGNSIGAARCSCDVDRDPRALSTVSCF